MVNLFRRLNRLFIIAIASTFTIIAVVALCVAMLIGTIAGYFHLRDWINLNRSLDYERTIARASSWYCQIAVFSLPTNAQSQPFAISSDDKDWQPNTRKRDQVVWQKTPTDLARHLYYPDPTKDWHCHIPAEIYERIITAAKDEGAWVTNDIDREEGFLFYSQPHQIAVSYSFVR